MEGAGEGRLEGFLCSCNTRSRKMWCKGGRSFLCSRSARPQKGLARRPQSKTPTALAGWVMNWKRGSMHALWGTVSHLFDDGRGRT